MISDILTKKSAGNAKKYTYALSTRSSPGFKTPVILDNVTSNKVLEIFWKDNGLDTIKSIIDNEDMAKKFYQLDDTPSDILELVYNFKERQQILSQLPKYKNLPKLAKFIDNVVSNLTYGKKLLFNKLGGMLILDQDYEVIKKEVGLEFPE